MFAIFAGLRLVVVFMAISFLLWQSCGPFRNRSQRPLATITAPVSLPRFDKAAEMYDVPLENKKQPLPPYGTSATLHPSSTKLFASPRPNRERLRRRCNPSRAAPRHAFWPATGNLFSRAKLCKDQGGDASSPHRSGDEELGLPYDSRPAEQNRWSLSWAETTLVDDGHTQEVTFRELGDITRMQNGYCPGADTAES